MPSRWMQRKFTFLSGEICLACGPLDSAYHGNMFGDQAAADAFQAMAGQGSQSAAGGP